MMATLPKSLRRTLGSNKPDSPAQHSTAAPLVLGPGPLGRSPSAALGPRPWHRRHTPGPGRLFAGSKLPGCFCWGGRGFHYWPGSAAPPPPNHGPGPRCFFLGRGFHYMYWPGSAACPQKTVDPPLPGSACTRLLRTRSWCNPTHPAL
jgi:hypothetical protein